MARKPKVTRRSRLIQDFAKLLIRHRDGSRTANLKNRIKELNEDIAALQQQVRDAERELAREGGPQNPEERASVELAAIRANDDVARVEVDGNRLLITTKPIFIIHGKTTYRMGEYVITFDFSHQHAEIHFTSLREWARDPDCIHPHIRQGGEACLGNISENVYELLRERRLASAVSLCVGFLKTYTNSGGYAAMTPISYWPTTTTDLNAWRRKVSKGSD